uniref:J domain-containing protein n=1 Tax=Ananas comosus var. bracteatus TaxID=296719 RepID=A0A6V7QXG6_ANACO
MRASVWKSLARLGHPHHPSQFTCSALLHSTAIALSKWTIKSDSKTHVRYTVRQKRSDAKSALKNLLLTGKSSSQDQSDKQRRSKKISKSKPHHPSPGKGHWTSKRWQNTKNFNEDDYENPYTSSATFGGRRPFTWSWSGFEWKDESQWTKAKKRVWSESDIEEEESSDIDMRSYRVTLGLPPIGPLKLEDLKSAFHASALQWHPDKHQGSSQALAEEKFKLCVDAYNTLSSVLKQKC